MELEEDEDEMRSEENECESQNSENMIMALQRRAGFQPHFELEEEHYGDEDEEEEEFGGIQLYPNDSDEEK